ncbi:hypothetical protein JD844_008318 [Phrynosoma platyrhinos]|uniref:Lung adenoma susceptibility protein 2 n=1 Tax=Phrynosoma platyrhinos TaxID=52577 RepID=A0ABQ7TFA1_PHRPL|nr:hypothetical protein JD844_008318 [Phrynosoma platyrhinos]
MACLIKKDNVYSPESTVSSLLASCSLHNNSSLNSHSSIQYKDKFYRSASQALEAYIEDFDRSFASPDLRPGKICITQRTPKDFRSSKDSFKHKDENLKQCTTLSSVTPHLRRKAAYELDMLSLTTDDLLAFPADGSASFIQSSVLRPVAPGSNLNRNSRSASVSCFPHRTSSFAHKEELNLTENPVSSVQADSNRKLHKKHKFYKYHSRLSEKDPPIKQDPKFVSHKNYPRWLTSQKSDLSISGISSIPDYKYPAWLKSHNLLSDSSSERCTLPHAEENDPTYLQDRKKLIWSQIQDRPNVIGNSNVLDMEYKHDVKKDCQYDTPNVCFTSQDLKKHMHLFKETSTEELTSVLKNDGSPCTVDVLEGERSWDNGPLGLKSPVPVCYEEENSLQSPKANIVNGFLEDCLKNSSQESTFSGGNHHGPVEALKLMLFNLQAVQHSFNQNKTVGQNEEFKKTSEGDVEFNLCDHDTIPVRQSLQRALHHLSRLKGLVEDTVCKEESKEFTKS